jgi:hypothetical protein
MAACNYEQHKTQSPSFFKTSLNFTYTTYPETHKKFHTIDLSVKSPSVSPPISSAFTPYPFFQWYPQSKEILLNLGMKC